MIRRHEGRTAVISGAASGIGQASAIRLAKEGAEIIIADRDKAEKTLQLIADFGGKATAFECDVTSPASVAAFRAALDAAGARCDILVNNAGIYPMQTFDEMTFEDWRHVLTVNLEFDVSDDQSIHRWNEATQMGADRKHSVGHRQFGLTGFCALRRQQGWGHRVHAVARDRVWSERHHCKRYRTGIDTNSRY